MMQISSSYKCKIHNKSLEKSRWTPTSYKCNQCKEEGLNWLFDISELQNQEMQKKIFLSHELWINPGTVIKSLQIILNYSLDDAIDLVRNAANNGKISLNTPKNKALALVKKELDDFIYDDLEKYYPNLFSIE